MTKHLLLGLACLGLILAGPAVAQERTPAARDTARAKPAVQTDQAFRSSTIVGMNVKNPQGEDLGEVNELVIDLQTGRVRYAALSFGGFLGVGDKLFAVPMEALTLKQGEDDRYFVLNVDKEKLKTAQGFNQDKWPNFANKEWAAGIDKFYGVDRNDQNAHQGLVVATAANKLTMTDMEGQNQHSHIIGPDVQITLNGESADLDDLQKGHQVKVTTADRDGAKVVVSIQGFSRRTAAKPVVPDRPKP
jgi:sporulation protein YlmC with PRC-barrel domain